MTTDYSAMPAPATEFSASTVLAHTIDSAAFRYTWATADLPDTALGFTPAPGSMGLGELLIHMDRLAGWLQATLTDEGFQAAESAETARGRTLKALSSCSASVRAMTTEALEDVKLAHSEGKTLTAWNLIHGPLADFLTHLGQVTAWRRMAGCPAPAPQYALGLGPAEGEAKEGAAAAASRGLQVQDADLTESSFRDVALTGSTFDDVSLAGAKFNNATFAGATLHNVDLSNVNITDANVDGLRIDGELFSGE